MASRKYALPDFLTGRVSPEVYFRWLHRKAIAHIKRDRRRGNPNAMREPYMKAIHEAVIACAGKDCYTGEDLAWEKISTYDNEASKNGRRAYKKSLWALPTVDHVGDGLSAPEFQITSWRTNDCKNDLSATELVEFCRSVLAHHERRA